MSITVPTLSSSMHEVGPGGRGPVGEQPHRRVVERRRPRTRRRAGCASGGTASTTSPKMPSGSRLVVSIAQPGQRPSRNSATRAAPSRTCSQLSRTITTSRSAEHVEQPVLGVDGSAPGTAVEQVLLAQPERAEHDLGDVGAVGDGGELGEPDAVGRIDAGRPPRSRAGSCPRRPGRPASPAGCRASASRTRAISLSRPTKLVSAAVRLVRGAAVRRGAASSPRSTARCACWRSADGSTPSSSARRSRTDSYARSASAWRPARPSVVTSA